MPPTPQCLTLCSSTLLLFRALFLRSYTWRTTEWSDCRVDLLLSQQDRRRSNLTGLCGGGLQTREVYCVQANAELLKYLSDLREKDKGKKKLKYEHLFYSLKAAKMLLLVRVSAFCHCLSSFRMFMDLSHKTLG